MHLRIAFDLDGVFADMEAALAREARRLFGERVTRRVQPALGPAAAAATDAAAIRNASDLASAPVSGVDLDSRQLRRLWHHVATIDNFWMSLDELEPGAVGRLATLAADRRWHVIFLTRRSETAGSTAQVQTQRWLASKGFLLPSVYVVHGSRGHIAAALGLDVVVDDCPENCVDVLADSQARAILVCRNEQAVLPQVAKRLGIAAVNSVAESLDILKAIDVETDASS